MTISDGVNFSAQLQVNIIPNRWDVTWKASGANADVVNVNCQIATVLSGTLARGDLVSLRSATYNPAALTNPATSRQIIGKGTYTGSSGVITIQGEVAGDTNALWDGFWPLSAPARMGGGAKIAYLEFDTFGGTVDWSHKWVNVSFFNPNASAQDPETQFGCPLAYTGGTGSNVEITNCFFSSRINASPILANPQTVGTAGLPGSGVFFQAGNFSGINIHDSEGYGISDLVVITGSSGSCTNLICDGNVIHQFYLRYLFAGQPVGGHANYNLAYDHRYDPTTGVHGDYQIWTNQNNSGSVAGFNSIGNIHLHGVPMQVGSDLYNDGISCFWENDVGAATYTNVVISGNTVVSGLAHAPGLNATPGVKVQFNSLIMDLTPGITLPNVGNPNGTSQVLPPTVLASGCTGLIVDGNAISQPFILEGGSTISSQIGVVNTGTTPAGYNAAYNNVAAAMGVSVTPANIHSIIQALSIKPGGTLDKAANGNAFSSGSLGNCVDFVNRTYTPPI
jgi:hypothetical protein